MLTQVYPFLGNPIFRPIVPIRVINPTSKKAITTYALLDTGADSCMFPNFVPETLGYVLKDGLLVPNNLGLGGKKDAWSHPFRIELLDAGRQSIVWKSGEITIRCIEDEKKQMPPILGFSDFMCHFRVSFNHSTKRIVIQDPI